MVVPIEQRRVDERIVLLRMSTVVTAGARGLVTGQRGRQTGLFGRARPVNGLQHHGMELLRREQHGIVDHALVMVVPFPVRGHGGVAAQLVLVMVMVIAVVVPVTGLAVLRLLRRRRRWWRRLRLRMVVGHVHVLVGRARAVRAHHRAGRVAVAVVPVVVRRYRGRGGIAVMVHRGRRPRAVHLDVLRGRRPDDQVLVLVLQLVAAPRLFAVHSQVERLIVPDAAALVRLERGRRTALRPERRPRRRRRRRAASVPGQVERHHVVIVLVVVLVLVRVPAVVVATVMMMMMVVVLVMVLLVVVVVLLLLLVVLLVVMVVGGRVHGTLFGRHARHDGGHGDHLARTGVLLAHAGRVARMVRYCWCGHGSWVVGVPRRRRRVHHAHHFGHAVCKQRIDTLFPRSLHDIILCTCNNISAFARLHSEIYKYENASSSLQSLCLV